MSPLAQFLDVLLHDGRAVLRDPPSSPLVEDKAATGLLHRAFADHRLTVSGPLLDFAPATALAAARLVYAASWLLISRAEQESELDRLLVSPPPPRSPSEHFSADLVLRFLVHIHRRSRAHDPADRLTSLLADLLRRWPLTGVLADLDDMALTPVDFSDHGGLMMLYAERFVAHPKSGWEPTGKGLEYLELVCNAIGKDIDKVLLPEPAQGAVPHWRKHR